VVSLDPHRFVLIAALWAIYSIMGCFIDGFSMIVLTTSVVLPIIEKAGFDKIWFGIFMVIIIEIAQITPPLGFNLFVLQGMTGQEIFSITKAALPFFFLMSLLAALITIFPEIVTWLPSTILSQ
jgi:TRAP-type C4-dicarboxylate transport system permease large subunit